MAGRTVIITGASDGIGAAAAARLSRSGENVAVVGRSDENRIMTQRELEDLSPDECFRLLATARVGRLRCCARDENCGDAYVIPK